MCNAVPAVQEVDDLFYAPSCSDNHQIVSRFYLEIRSRGGGGLLASQHRHDRDPRARSHPCLSDRPTGVGRVLPHREPVDREALDALLQLVQFLGDARASEEVCERAGVVVTEPQHPLERIRILRIGQEHLFASGAVRYDTDALSLLRSELVAHPQSW